MDHPSPVRDAVDAIVSGWSRSRPELDVAPIQVMLRVARVRAAVERATEENFARFGLSAASFSALAAIARIDDEAGATPSRLMRDLRLTSGTVSVRIDRLVADGLAERATDPDDGRVSRVRLTGLGRQRFDAAAPAHLATERRLVSALAPVRRAALADLLRDLLIDLEGEDGGVEVLGMALTPAHLTAAMRAAVGLSEAPGLLVRGVQPDGPAGRIGVREGDVLTAIDDTTIHGTADALRAGATGRTVGALGVLRGHELLRLGEGAA
ncbi:MAG: MarR family transcriptional regulator [Miltoncostaeaceae bacterium]